MNLVKLVMDQLSGDTIGKLSGLLGTDRSTAVSAASAAVPSLLAGVLGMASDEDGARKLSSTLTSIDTSSGDFMRTLSADSGLLAQKGSSLLGTLFGSSTRSGLVESISRFSGLGSGATSNLLSILAPMIISKVATAWKSMGGGLSALTGMFADQKQNIANALPTGFSLGNIPGFGAIGSALGTAAGAVGTASSSVAGATRRAAETVETTPRSNKGWLAGLAALLVLGFIVWNIRSPSDPMRSSTTTMPSAELTGDFRATLNSLGETLAGIRDAASAQDALPKLRNENTKLDDLQTTFTGLPESERSTLRSTIGPQLSGVTDRVSETLKIPGLNAESKTVLEQIMRKLSTWGVMPMSTLPTP